MPRKSYWRRAIIASCLVHCLFLVGAGWWNGKNIHLSNVPEYIEMELISDIAAPEQAANIPEAAPEQAVNVPEAQAPVTPAAMPTVAQVARPAVSAVTSDMVANSFVPEQSDAPAMSGNYSASVPAMATPGSSGTASGSAGTAPAGPKRIAAPRVLSKVEPVFPEEAKQAGFGGTVAVKIEIL